ncbi:ROK family protein [Devosia sp.]|uniref:ROK family protein n=1 Tax=Devosia sp. TaxID=1871048 RepID=UPI0032630420
MNQRFTTSPVLRQLSVRAVMERLLRDGAASRASLSRSTGLSKQTISEVMLVLAERGWVRESGIISGGVGRTAVRYAIDARAGFALGLDLGASTLRGVLSDISGTIVAEHELAADGRGGQLAVQARALKASLLKAADAPADRVQIATVATPGVMNPQGHLDLAPNLPGIRAVDLASQLRDALECQVIFENDVNAAALGEYWEAGENADNHFAFVSLGTGVGLGILIDGKLLRGSGLAAGEIGYLPLGGDPYAASSLDRGALESAIGAVGIKERYQLLSGDGAASMRDIFDRFNAGEAAARRTIEETARIAALVVLTITSVVDPDRVVFGGNIGARPELVALIDAMMPKVQRRPIRVEAGRLGPRATVLGATAISLGEMHNSLFSSLELPGRIGLPTLRQ